MPTKKKKPLAKKLSNLSPAALARVKKSSNKAPGSRVSKAANKETAKRKRK